MDIRIQCRCGNQWEADRSLAGQRILCPACDRRVTVPGQEQPDPPSPAPRKLGRCPSCGSKRQQAGPICEFCGERDPNSPEARRRQAARTLDELWELRATLIAAQLFGFVVIFCGFGLLYSPAALLAPVLFSGLLIHCFAKKPKKMTAAMRRRWARETWITAGQLVLSIVLGVAYWVVLLLIVAANRGGAGHG